MHLNRLEIVLAPEVILAVTPSRAIVEIPMREYLTTTPVLESWANPLADTREGTRREVLSRDGPRAAGPAPSPRLTSAERFLAYDSR